LENIITVWTNESRVLNRYKAAEELKDIEGAEDIYIITEGIELEEY